MTEQVCFFFFFATVTKQKKKKKASQHWTFLSHLWQFYTPTFHSPLPKKDCISSQTLTCGSNADQRVRSEHVAAGAGLCDGDRRRDELRCHGRRSNERRDSEGGKKKKNLKNLPVALFTLLHPNPPLPLGNEPHLYTTLNTREKL